MKEVNFFKCEICGNIIHFIVQAGPRIVCCGQGMKELIPGTVDASYEKHIPHVEISGDKMKVQIGAIIHPMTAEHYIAFIFVQTNKGGQIKYLSQGSDPVAEFNFADEKPVAVYEYCNLHGLWKAEVK